jgi:radical SAM superfamily enzyme with C-terminal helix-hairpin-helix motif
MRLLIVNGYSDEPTCLNVPPYIGKQPRYIAGAVLSAGGEVTYSTIDDFRKNRLSPWKIDGKFDAVIFIVGMTVPGKYVGGDIATVGEIVSIATSLPKTKLKILGGPAAKFGFGSEGGKTTEIVREPFDIICKGDEEAVAYSLAKTGKATGLEKLKRDDPLLSEFAVRGAAIIKQIDPTYLLAEIETYRGCPRFVSGFCSFCSEMGKGPPDFRSIDSIVSEVRALASFGVHAFRLGDQPDLFAYLGEGAGKIEYPKPNPEAIEKLFSGVRKAAPNLTVLHIDNVNPGTIVAHPKESLEVAKIIAKYDTPGDIAAFGVESLDPIVIKKNNLKVDSEGAMEAVRIINEAGNWREGKSLPKLLPGINFIGGLEGETKETFKINYRFLESLLKEKLLVRRINLRQVMPLPGTRMAKTGDKIVKKHSREFESFKFKVRGNIDHPMLRLVAPVGTFLPGCRAEYRDGKLTFCRQLGSYPLLVGVPAELPLNQYHDLKVVDWGNRSITGVPSKIDLNSAPREILEYLPGIGKKNIVKLLAKRPVSAPADFIDEPDSRKKLEEFLG